MEEYSFERRKAFNLACIALLCLYAFGVPFVIAGWGI